MKKFLFGLLLGIGIGIFGAVLTRSFQTFAAKSRTAEVKTLLGSVYHSVTAFHAANNRYPNSLEEAGVMKFVDDQVQIKYRSDGATFSASARLKQVPVLRHCPQYTYSINEDKELVAGDSLFVQ